MIKLVLFGVVALGLTAAGLYGRAANVKYARTQAAQVVSLDASGADAAAALAQLRSYAASHTGAGVTLTLAGSYSRAQTAAKAAAAASAANSQIYAAAQAACSGKSDSISQARCNQDYLAKHLVNLPAAAPVVQPQPADYRYELASPFWAPDLAGACFLGAAAALVVPIISLVLFKSRKRRS